MVVWIMLAGPYCPASNLSICMSNDQPDQKRLIKVEPAHVTTWRPNRKRLNENFDALKNLSGSRMLSGARGLRCVRVREGQRNVKFINHWRTTFFMTWLQFFFYFIIQIMEIHSCYYFVWVFVWIVQQSTSGEYHLYNFKVEWNSVWAFTAVASVHFRRFVSTNPFLPAFCTLKPHKQPKKRIHFFVEVINYFKCRMK